MELTTITQSETAKKGFWSWFKSTVKAIVTEVTKQVPLIGPSLSEWLEEKMTSWGMRMFSVDLTFEEEVKVTNWLRAKFQPFYIHLCEKLETKPVSFRTTVDEKTAFIATVNYVRHQMAIAQANSKDGHFPDWSANASIARNEFIAKLFEGLEAVILQRFEAKDMLFTENNKSIVASTTTSLPGGLVLEWNGKTVHTTYKQIPVESSSNTVEVIDVIDPINTGDATTSNDSKKINYGKALIRLGTIGLIMYGLSKSVKSKRKSK